MATYTASFTVNPGENGNVSSYIYYGNTTYTIPQSMNNNNLVDDMNMMQTGLSSFGGTVSYVLTGGSSWGEIVTVTWTIVDPTFIPEFIAITTENFYYPMKFDATPVAPTLCNQCQLIQLTQCGADSFHLDLGLADGPYTAYYADNTSGVIWEQGTYSNTAQGGLSMYQWQATSGMFNEFSFYTLTIRDTNGDAVSWIRDGIEYTCATLTFKKTVNVTD